MKPDYEAVWTPDGSPPRLMVVTGEIGAGKTTWCAGLIAHVRQHDIRLAGLLSTAVFVDGTKQAIDLVELEHGERRRLANRRPVPDTTLPTPGWAFDAATLAWGGEVLAGISAVDVLIIDELGPLELLHGAGWAAALPLLERRAYRLACVVVRPRLLDVFVGRFPETEIVRID
jgi:nucleoside-triphosphatase THEP1